MELKVGKLYQCSFAYVVVYKTKEGAAPNAAIVNFDPTPINESSKDRICYIKPDTPFLILKKEENLNPTVHNDVYQINIDELIGWINFNKINQFEFRELKHHERF